MSDQELLERIVCDPKILVGKPVVRGTRLSVEYILNLQAHGASVEEILEDHPHLDRLDLQACLLFVSHLLADATFLPLAAESA